MGDKVYVVADDQAELVGVVREISGNRLKLNFVVPKKYTTGNATRVYKLVTNTI